MEKLTQEEIIEHIKDLLWDYYEEVFWATEAKHNEDEKGRDVFCEEQVEEAIKRLKL